MQKLKGKWSIPAGQAQRMWLGHLNRFEKLQVIPYKRAHGEHCPELTMILIFSYIVIMSDAFSLKGLFDNAIGRL